MYSAEILIRQQSFFPKTLDNAKDGEQPSDDLRQNVKRTIYTIQQSIGAALDALPAGKSNQARKVNGDLFERLILLIIVRSMSIAYQALCRCLSKTQTEQSF